MDIEEPQDDNQESEKEACGTEKKGRDKKVQLADELMKRALRPYFT